MNINGSIYSWPPKRCVFTLPLQVFTTEGKINVFLLYVRARMCLNWMTLTQDNLDSTFVVQCRLSAMLYVHVMEGSQRCT